MVSHQEQTAYSSRLPQIMTEYQKKLQRIDVIERRIEEIVSEKRQRALNILDETPTHRKSHLRLFCTHKCREEVKHVSLPSPKNPEHLECTTVSEKKEKKKCNKWTLIIEGRLLVGHLDHERVANIEKEAAGSEKVDAGKSQSDGKGEGGDLSTNLAPRSSDRQANRAIYDREGEEPISPIKFTHFFDRISVSFQSFKGDKSKKDRLTADDIDGGQASRSKRSPRRDPLVSTTKKFKTNNLVKTLIWNRKPQRKTSTVQLENPDSYAFHAIYDEEQERPDEERSVVATIRLHRRPSGEQKYLPSVELCKHLFPSLLAEAENRSQTSRRNEGGKINKNDSIPSKNSDVDAAQSVSGDNTTSKARHSTATAPYYDVPPADNSYRVPSLFTHDEVVNAIFIYAKDRNLFDTTDMSIIRNDSALQRLFDCKEMNISVMKSLILSRHLLHPIVQENPEYDAAIECTYVMTKDSDVSCEISPGGKASGPTVTTPAESNTSTLALEPATKKRRSQSPDSHKKILETKQNVLSFDIDMDVPSLLHFRTRDILRRIKVREQEYTSSRTKAIRTVQSTGADEDVVRDQLDDIVKGKALTSGHIPVLLALAKSAPPGSEARKEAHIDARMAMLLDRLEHHGKMAKAYWNIVDACQGNIL